MKKKFEKNCKECGNIFIAMNVRALFCSNHCKVKNSKKNNIKEYKKKCVCCEKEFISNSNKVKFCSMSCSASYKNNNGEKYSFCKTCGIKFKQKHARNIYCSRACKEKNNGLIKTKFKPCSNCGTNVYRKYFKHDITNIFCNKECESKFKQKESQDVRHCETCGKEFICKKSDKLRFCSYFCQGVWQSKYRSGKNHPSYNHSITDEMRVKKCEYCKKEMPVDAYEIGTKKFCSRSCMVKGMKKSLTSPHRKVCALMEELNIEYEIEKPFYKYSFDCFIKNSNLAIEVMGTYWHSDPRIYLFPKDDLQKNGEKRDGRKKNKSDLENIFILYLWEKDINENLTLCKELILKYILNNGNLENYHSFNYFIEKENIIKKNDKILVPEFEKNNYNTSND